LVRVGPGLLASSKNGVWVGKNGLLFIETGEFLVLKYFRQIPQRIFLTSAFVYSGWVFPFLVIASRPCDPGCYRNSRRHAFSTFAYPTTRVLQSSSPITPSVKDTTTTTNIFTYASPSTFHATTTIVSFSFPPHVPVRAGPPSDFGMRRASGQPTSPRRRRLRRTSRPYVLLGLKTQTSICR